MRFLIYLPQGLIFSATIFVQKGQKPTKSKAAFLNSSNSNYENRKKEHIQLALQEDSSAKSSGLSKIRLIHSALPEMNWDEIDISRQILGKKRKTPFFVSAMTGGFQDSPAINFKIAKACEKQGWMMGVGSQRRLWTDPSAKKEWVQIKKAFPRLAVFGNLGLSQLSHFPIEQTVELMETLKAEALMIHTNPLQECLQPEGTPHFKNGLKSLSLICQKLSIPVGLKETGCGVSFNNLQSLCNIGLSVVDVSGYGGSHFGRIEGHRTPPQDIKHKAAKTYAHWGNSTLSSLLSAQKLKEKDFEIWASGGLTHGLDAAKCLALQASACGFARVILQALQEGEKALENKMNLMEYELKIALFCTASPTLQDLHSKWEWIETHRS